MQVTDLGEAGLGHHTHAIGGLAMADRAVNIEFLLPAAQEGGRVGGGQAEFLRHSRAEIITETPGVVVIGGQRAIAVGGGHPALGNRLFRQRVADRTVFGMSGREAMPSAKKPLGFCALTLCCWSMSGRSWIGGFSDFMPR